METPSWSDTKTSLFIMLFAGPVPFMQNKRWNIRHYLC
jgi:hypothetical protein